MKYHWQSKFSGEIVLNIFDVIKSILHDIKHYGFSFNWFSWKYSRKGF